MNWDAIAAMGQAVSALALIVVIVQIRHARSESRRAISRGRTEAVREINSAYLDESVARIWTKAMNELGAPIPPLSAALMERANLTRDEAWIVVALARTYWSYVVQNIASIHELSASERNEFDQTIRFNYGASGGPSHMFYEIYIKPRAHPDAVRYVENVLAQPG